jgi:hypothetical protein
MRKKAQRDLTQQVENRLVELKHSLSGPTLIVKFLNEKLTPVERRIVGRSGIDSHTDPVNWVSARKVIEVVAERRRLTLERALPELSVSLELISYQK